MKVSFIKCDKCNRLLEIDSADFKIVSGKITITNGDVKEYVLKDQHVCKSCLRKLNDWLATLAGVK